MNIHKMNIHFLDKLLRLRPPNKLCQASPPNSPQIIFLHMQDSLFSLTNRLYFSSPRTFKKLSINDLGKCLS